MSSIILGTVKLEETKWVGSWSNRQQVKELVTYQYQAKDEAKDWLGNLTAWKWQRRQDGKGPWKDAPDLDGRYTDTLGTKPTYRDFDEALVVFTRLCEEKAVSYSFADARISSKAEGIRQERQERQKEYERQHQESMRKFAQVADTSFIESRHGTPTLYLHVEGERNSEEKLVALTLTPDVILTLRQRLAEIY